MSDLLYSTYRHDDKKERCWKFSRLEDLKKGTIRGNRMYMEK